MTAAQIAPLLRVSRARVYQLAGEMSPSPQPERPFHTEAKPDE